MVRFPAFGGLNRLREKREAVEGALVGGFATQDLLKFALGFFVHAEHRVGERQIRSYVDATGDQRHCALEFVERFVEHSDKTVDKTELMMPVARVRVFAQ